MKQGFLEVVAVSWVKTWFIRARTWHVMGGGGLCARRGPETSEVGGQWHYSDPYKSSANPSAPLTPLPIALCATQRLWLSHLQQASCSPSAFSQTAFSLSRVGSRDAWMECQLCGRVGKPLAESLLSCLGTPGAAEWISGLERWEPVGGAASRGPNHGQAVLSPDR